MISTSATSTNHCSYHWPSIHRLCAVPDERARLFFLIYILNCSAGNKSRVSGKLFAKWKKKKKQGTCRGKCFPVLAELAVGKSSTHKVSLSRTFSLIRIPGRGAAGSRAHLLEIFRYFTVFFFLLAASGASSTCGHPFSCGTARSRAPCVSCSWGWQHLGNSNHRLPPSLCSPSLLVCFYLIPFGSGLNPVIDALPWISKLWGLQQMWSVAEP